MSLTTGMKAVKLVFMSSVPGVMTDPKDPATLISSLTDVEVRELTAQTIARVRTTPEAREGFAAFLGKRKPNWNANE